MASSGCDERARDLEQTPQAQNTRLPRRLPAAVLIET